MTHRADAGTIAAIRDWNARQDHARDAYYNGIRCDVCGHRSKRGGASTVCSACRKAATRAKKRAEVAAALSVTARKIVGEGHDTSRPPSGAATPLLRGLADRKDTTDS